MEAGMLFGELTLIKNSLSTFGSRDMSIVPYKLDYYYMIVI
jgi:hypothetical protein